MKGSIRKQGAARVLFHTNTLFTIGWNSAVCCACNVLSVPLTADDEHYMGITSLEIDRRELLISRSEFARIKDDKEQISFEQVFSQESRIIPRA